MSKLMTHVRQMFHLRVVQTAKDLLTDSNGVRFHRFQMIFWTLVLGLLIHQRRLQGPGIPEFSGTMSALMGISAGAYLGFKIQRQV